MARIEVFITGEFEAVGALKVLEAANNVVKMLRGIEKAQTGKRAKIKWLVDIQTVSRRP